MFKHSTNYLASLASQPPRTPTPHPLPTHILTAPRSVIVNTLPSTLIVADALDHPKPQWLHIGRVRKALRMSSRGSWSATSSQSNAALYDDDKLIAWYVGPISIVNLEQVYPAAVHYPLDSKWRRKTWQRQDRQRTHNKGKVSPPADSLPPIRSHLFHLIPAVPRLCTAMDNAWHKGDENPVAPEIYHHRQ
ncbi:hypothetical protein BDZ97DRAFT_1076219 [Flammula alnicola]|nr:hypothetical protein BDZ97DRAFT_1076219 [Flammula alnicola]